MVERWVEGVDALARVAKRFPHAAYAGLTACLQAEWQYLCRVVPDVGPLLEPIEIALRERFIPALLSLESQDVTDNFRKLLGQGVKQGGLAIRNPCEAAATLLETSMEATLLLSNALVAGEELCIEAHKAAVRSAGAKSRKEKKDLEKGFLATMGLEGRKIAKRLERMNETGSWLQSIPNRLDGTEMSQQEWHDNISLRYGFRPKGLPDRCDGCLEGFTVEHGLSCKKGGFVGARHDDARDEWAHLCASALTASRVCTEPEIFYGAGVVAGHRGGTAAEANLGDEARGDVKAHGFWKRGRGTIFDIRITDTDARSYGNTDSRKILECHAREKKSKYEEACLERRRDFTPMVYSVDGLASKETRAAERRLASMLASKWDRN